MRNLADLMKQAAGMQRKMEEFQTALEAMEVTGESGAGLVRLSLNGKHELKSVSIDPKVAGDTDMLGDLLMAAHADAVRKIAAARSAEMEKMTGGLPLPPGFKLPF